MRQAEFSPTCLVAMFVEAPQPHLFASFSQERIFLTVSLIFLIYTIILKVLISVIITTVITQEEVEGIVRQSFLPILEVHYYPQELNQKTEVCIVEKRGTGKLYAMKYMNKCQCLERDALNNVLKEVEILAALEHPFLVNLWFSFQDEEDLFMVSDLFMGGDLRYHIQQKVHFKEDCARLYIFELGLALEYLQSKCIVHRDVKPDNILLDENGHAHLTDFNIATVLREGQLATSMSGTKPYMAPEIFACVTDECVGYNFAVDWWSLGVCAYEMLALSRPYDIHSTTSINDVRSLFHTPLVYPRHWTPGTVDLLSKLLCVEPGARISSLSELKTMPAVSKFDVTQVLEKKIKPSFIPPKDHLNCDPTLELEEMIVEAKPLHKKKKRLAKQRSFQPAMSLDLSNEVHSPDTTKMIEFRVYNREQELRRRELEKKEKQWEEELLKSMKLCDLDETGGKQLNPTQSFSSHSLNKAKFRYKNIKKSSSYSYCVCEEKPYVEEKIDKQNSYECTCGSDEYSDVGLNEDVVPENKTAEILN